jgi:1-acyl-sn-glycerol-3-phosphate acyltransferase
MRHFFVGIFAVLLYAINILFWPFLIFIGALLRCVPIKSWQKMCNHFIHQIPIYWADINNVILGLTTSITWDIEGLENLKHDDWYLMIANHRSWADIIVLEKIFNRKIPLLKFFIKKELLWTIPVASWAAMILDFPYMERYTKAYLAKHPEKKGKDIETTRRVCKKFKNTPTTVISFVEGTRFTEAKKEKQQSPYQHLLRPRAGGIAFTLDALGEYFHKILNVTIVYPDAPKNAWEFFSGKVKKVIVHIETLPITPDLIGDYENDRTFRVYFQQWINELWHEKDKLIASILEKEGKN